MSGTAPAWQVREMEQQKLVSDLYGATLVIEDSRGEAYAFAAEVAQAAVQYLYGTILNDWRFTKPTWDLEEELTPAQEHFERVWREINTFARTGDEAGMLVVKLLEKLIGGSFGQFQSRWQREVLANPKKTLGNKDRMAQILIPR